MPNILIPKWHYSPPLLVVQIPYSSSYSLLLTAILLFCFLTLFLMSNPILLIDMILLIVYSLFCSSHIILSSLLVFYSSFHPIWSLQDSFHLSLKPSFLILHLYFLATFSCSRKSLFRSNLTASSALLKRRLFSWKSNQFQSWKADFQTAFPARTHAVYV